MGISAKRSQPRDFSQEISAKGSQPRDLSQEILAKSSQPRDPSQGNSAKGSRPGMFSQVMSADPWKRRDLNKRLCGVSRWCNCVPALVVFVVCLVRHVWCHCRLSYHSRLLLTTICFSSHGMSQLTGVGISWPL